jgi:hypothetical protein
MTSYKKIDLIKLYVKESSIFLDDKKLLIKTPIIYFDYKEDHIILKIKNNAENHVKFLQLCTHIERLFKTKGIKTNINNSLEIKVLINEISKFYDINASPINNIKHGGKIICSLECFNGTMSLVELLYIK